MPPEKYVEWAYDAADKEIKNEESRPCPDPVRESWRADCFESNTDNGETVGESWPGYVTFDEWKSLCAKIKARRNKWHP